MRCGEGGPRGRLRVQVIAYGGENFLLLFTVPKLQYATGLTTSLLLPSRSQTQDKTAEPKVKSQKWAFLGSTFIFSPFLARSMRAPRRGGMSSGETAPVTAS